LINEYKTRLFSKANSLTKPELVKFLHLIERYNVPLDEKESEILKLLRVKHGLLS
jgi:hypothetical protein